MKSCVILAVVGFLPLVLLHPIENNEAALQPRLDSFESLKISDLPSSDVSTTRDKRTIGPLRQIFPNLSQLVDSKIQMITRVLFRVIGRLVLRGGLGGGGGNSAASSNSSGSGNTQSRRISITLPTYPPGEDDEDEEEDEDANAQKTDTETTTEGDSKNQLDGAESQISEVRVPFDDSNAREGKDLDTAASEDGDAQIADNQDVAADASEDEEANEEQRNKRFLPFNLGGSAGGSAGGSGGGSGNFLFDIIRLVAGSGNTEASDERANSAVGVATAEQTVEKDDGYQAGVPGPITRLFIIANRGLANLMQDLILRLAQTSERIVNFKARLITSII